MSLSPLKFEEKPIILQSSIFQTQYEGDFLKLGCISPDGSTLLSCSEGNVVETIEMKPEVLGHFKYYGDRNNTPVVDPLIGQRKSIIVGESIYDCKWYPLMNVQDANSNCFVTTSRDHPITLWDAIGGTVRATYSGINHLDELDPATSLAFNMTGDKLYTGSNKMIRCFDISQPGRRFTAFPTTKNRKSPLGQKGLISAISFNPDYSGLYGAGSYANSIGLYVENSRESVMQMDQLAYGVTCLKWSPCGKYLWAGGRNSDAIQCWDVRSSGSCLGEVRRSLSSQQRMTFDLDPWGSFLATGSDNGQVLMYNTSTFELVSEFSSGECSCVNTTLFHPFSSLLYTVQGVRSFNGVGETDGDDSDDDLEQMQVSDGGVPNKKRKYESPVSSISVWSMGYDPLPMPVAVQEVDNSVTNDLVTSS